MKTRFLDQPKPKLHGPSGSVEEPRGSVGSTGKLHESSGLVEIDRAVRRSPTARPSVLVHKVRLEPTVRDHGYTVARYGLWRKLSPRGRSGIEFQTPITLNDSRYLYEITRSLTDLTRLSLSVERKWEITNAVRMYHDLRLYFLSQGGVFKSMLVKQYLKVIAVNLRLAKTTLRVAGHRISNPSDFVGSQT